MPICLSRRKKKEKDKLLDSDKHQRLEELEVDFSSFIPRNSDNRDSEKWETRFKDLELFRERRLMDTAMYQTLWK